MVRSPDSSPSDEFQPERTEPVVTRRRALAAAGGTLVALAGCAGRLPGTGLNEVSTTRIDERPGRIAWEYPPVEGEDDGIGYGAWKRQEPIRHGERSLSRLVFNSTVAEFSTVSSYNDYVPDWFRAGVAPPRRYQQRYTTPRTWAEPPGQWERFRTHYDGAGADRRFVLELRDVDTEGTIQVPVLLDAGTDPLPERVRCSFTVQASKPGQFGRTIRATAAGTLPLDPTEGG